MNKCRFYFQFYWVVRTFYLSTESGFDFLYIYDESGNQIGSYSGNIGATNTSIELKNSSAVRISFISDSSIAYSGIIVNVSLGKFQNFHLKTEIILKY